LGRVAVVKPDHLGDLVLASPAIRALGRTFDIVLYVGTPSLGLARFLFPDMEARPADFPYLARKSVPPLDIAQLGNELSMFDRVFILRDDGFMRSLAAHITVPVVVASGDHLTHDTLIHARALSGHIAPYSRTGMFAPAPISWPTAIRSVGLCIAAGFPTNAWALRYWHDLALRLNREGIALRILGGPGEHEMLGLLSSMLRNIAHQTVEGGAQFAQFLDDLADLDLIVAGDGGTAHICSLRKPVLSIFGSSPWRRYAPFGFTNVLMTRDLVCNPCVQFSTEEVNGCLTRECMASITPEDVFKVIVSNGEDFSAVRQVQVYRGVSHLDA